MIQSPKLFAQNLASQRRSSNLNNMLALPDHGFKAAPMTGMLNMRHTQLYGKQEKSPVLLNFSPPTGIQKPVAKKRGSKVLTSEQIFL
jgi:hypothetical protein